MEIVLLLSLLQMHLLTMRQMPRPMTTMNRLYRLKCQLATHLHLRLTLSLRPMKLSPPKETLPAMSRSHRRSLHQIKKLPPSQRKQKMNRLRRPKVTFPKKSPRQKPQLRPPTKTTPLEERMQSLQARRLKLPSLTQPPVTTPALSRQMRLRKKAMLEKATQTSRLQKLENLLRLLRLTTRQQKVQ